MKWPKCQTENPDDSKFCKESGLGEVYRGVDKKLDRQLAFKVLPTAFAEDAERLARFEPLLILHSV